MDKEEYLSVIDIDLKKVALSSLVMTALLSIAGLFIYVELYNGFSITFTFIDILLFIIGYIVLIILHEIFHLIGFWFFGKVPWSSMDYGVNLKLGVAYATTTIPLKNSAMKKALLLPFWMTGLIPMLIGYSVQLPMLVILGAWLIAGAAGDFAMYKELRNFPSDVLIKDDPVKPRLYVLKKN
ncbi:putative zincin peptidase [Psychrobacillus insolitus]|uniref:Putative zincin peptidase n=1 Tax=Psychrobacillus insolitus TaxID=1461 RepID=A0A2W7MG93_9BACI|nr:DUF3267 domain-containing protein [Psychrobacillus insolitus]PZX03730.1 putative zincin peptidase [Psychrobacillus insolitus]